jgi:pentapeptide repeat protein
MANPEHLQILEQGVEAWNQWREQHPDISPDLAEADLYGADLDMANFSRANLSKANLRGATLDMADFSEANLSEANLYGANFRGAALDMAVLRGATLYTADLDMADLNTADLRGASLSLASLEKANLHWTSYHLSTPIGQIFTPSARPAHDASGWHHSTCDDATWPSGYAAVDRQYCVRPGHAAVPSPATPHIRC